LTARFDTQAWSVPPIFNLIQKRGNVDRDEMYHVFNMGIGMVIICSSSNVDHFTRVLPEARVIGEVIKQKEARIIID